MSRASRYIYNFLDNNLGLYLNRQGVEFIVNNDDSVFVDYLIKDTSLSANFDIGLFYENDNFNDFIRDFQLAGMQQLKAVSSAHLWELYYKGQAEIYCVFAKEMIYFPLYFRLEGNKMIVCDDRDNKHELDKILLTPAQFAAYTRQQFLLH